MASQLATKDIQLPEIGEGVTEGELVKWLVAVGDQVKADQAIAEMMTDKATVEVPSPSSGRVLSLELKEGEICKVGQTLLRLELAGVDASVSKPAQPSQAPAVSAAQMGAGGRAAVTASAPSAGSAANGAGAHEFYPPVAESQVLATPHTRRLAREMGVDINHLQGSGLAGRVTRDDVLGARAPSGMAATSGGMAANSSAAAVVPAAKFFQNGLGGVPKGGLEERVPLRGIRKKIAENMQAAKHIIPHFTLMDEANVTELVRLREQTREAAEKVGVKVTYLPFVIKALIATCREFPMFNASIDDQASEIVYKKSFNVGFAADTPSGLLVPVIHQAEQKSILQLSAEISDLAKRARDSKLRPEEMKGATITITNIGSVGGSYATPIINHPEVAILGMYRISEKPVYRDGSLVPVKMMNFTITADHRLIDGAVAANFLRAFFGRIENPGSLMMDLI